MSRAWSVVGERFGVMRLEVLNRVVAHECFANEHSFGNLFDYDDGWERWLLGKVPAHGDRTNYGAIWDAHRFELLAREERSGRGRDAVGHANTSRAEPISSGPRFPSSGAPQ